MDRAALITHVREVAAEAIGIGPDEVTEDSNLFDLGAQSLEFLDIVFKLEQTYDVEITRGALERAARGDMRDEDFAPDGFISPLGLERLRALMPEAADRVKTGLRPNQILGLFTVQTFARIVERSVEERSAEKAR